MWKLNKPVLSRQLWSLIKEFPVLRATKAQKNLTNIHLNSYFLKFIQPDI